MQKKNINSKIVTLNWPVPGISALTSQRGAAELDCPTNCYGNFNLGLHVGDNAHSVERNRAALLLALPSDVDIQWLEQIHGSDVAVIDKFSKEPVVADAAITQNNHVALAVMTADCLPILISSVSGDEIAVIHAGWRPLAQNIISKTIFQMKAQPNELVVWLGPCISEHVFEVGNEVKECFTEIAPVLAKAFVKQASGKYLADLKMIARSQLSQLGVNHIENLDDCTYLQDSLYYSYRRDKITGRMASVICIHP